MQLAFVSVIASIAVTALLPVVPASAECAWALWMNPTMEPTGWRLVSGAPAWYGSKSDCQSTAAYREAGTSRQPGDVMCLPKGVEPRGKPASYEYRLVESSGEAANASHVGGRSWVLWGAQRRHDSDADAKSWWVQAAYPTRQECESRRGFVHRRRTTDDVSYECFPDTIDPRGPKGGGR